MKKRIGALIAIAIVGWAVWFFLIKESVYTISFKADQPGGMVKEHVLRWPNSATKDLDSIVLTDQGAGMLQQLVHIADSTHQYKWQFTAAEAGKTQVAVDVSDPGHNFSQKWKSLFGKSDFAHRSMANTRAVQKALEIEGEKFKVHSFKDTLVEGQFCAYLPVEATTRTKARSMLYSIGFIMEYINSNGLELKGDPFLEVRSWEPGQDKLVYDFCFPINQSDSLPASETIQFKTSKSFRALKAEFNGNYNVSHRAWYYLQDHAKAEGIKVDSLATEIFLNDPHEGGDPLLWKALIFLPLEEQ